MAALITRDDLAEKLAARAEIPMVAAREEVKWFFDTIGAELVAGNEVRVHGFGTFLTAERAARTARNPATGESVKVAARRVARFKPSTTLSTALKAKGGRGGAAKKRAK